MKIRRLRGGGGLEKSAHMLNLISLNGFANSQSRKPISSLWVQNAAEVGKYHKILLVLNAVWSSWLASCKPTCIAKRGKVMAHITCWHSKSFENSFCRSSAQRTLGSSCILPSVRPNHSNYLCNKTGIKKNEPHRMMHSVNTLIVETADTRSVHFKRCLVL